MVEEFIKINEIVPIRIHIRDINYKRNIEKMKKFENMNIPIIKWKKNDCDNDEEDRFLLI